MGKTPRDFDLITDATWRQIKRRMGSRAIIVGRRFRVAHVYSADPKDPRAEMCELVAMQEHDRVDRAKRERGGSAPNKGWFGTNRRTKAGRGNDARHDGSSPDDDLDDLLYGDSDAETAARAADGAHERWLRRLRVNARGRCFTVNAMMYDVETGVLYDFAAGWTTSTLNESAPSVDRTSRSRMIPRACSEPSASPRGTAWRPRERS